MPTPENRLDPSLRAFTQTLQIAPDGSVSAIEACPETVHASPSDSAAGAVLGGASLGDQWRAAGGRSGNLPQGERYQTGEVLGIGASGRVFAVTDRNLERTVAAKLLSDAEGDVDRSEKFLREARLMARLDHPNVIPIYDAAIAPNGQPYFTMKTIAGVTLGEAIRQVESGIAAPRIATPSDVARIVVDVCKAVSYAHHRGVIHQDIKPDNIMMGEFGEVLLLDWGSALCVAPDGTVEGQSYGTPLYMSPEQARGERASRLSDIYCLGATFFHALVGRLPTWADDPDVFWTRKRAGTITPPTAAERRRVPPALLGIALKASAADNAQRYASVDALLADLQRWQSGLTIDAYRESLLQFLGRWSVRNRRSLLVACAMLALIILAGGLWYESWRKEQVSWTLAMQEDFAGPIDRIANDWQPNYTCINLAIPEPYSDVPLGKSHSWYMGDGGLETDAGVDDINLTCKRVFPANVRIEWDYLDRSGTTNLNCYFGSNRSAGYTFHVAGWNNDRSVVLTRGASYARLDWSIIKAMTWGVPHHFIMERADGHYRLSIDGDQVIDFQVIGGMDSPDAPTFGFDSFMNALTVRNVRVYTQRPPQLVSPLAVADAFYSAQHFNEAETSAVQHHRCILSRQRSRDQSAIRHRALPVAIQEDRGGGGRARRVLPAASGRPPRAIRARGAGAHRGIAERPPHGNEPDAADDAFRRASGHARADRRIQRGPLQGPVSRSGQDHRGRGVHARAPAADPGCHPRTGSDGRGSTAWTARSCGCAWTDAGRADAPWPQQLRRGAFADRHRSIERAVQPGSIRPGDIRSSGDPCPAEPDLHRRAAV